MKGEPVAVRFYAAVIRLYPTRFRDEYGSDMVSLFRDQCRDEPMSRVLWRAGVDLAITIPKQHLEARMRRASSPLVPIIYLTIALAGALLAVIGGSNAVTAVIGLAIALGAGTIGVIAWRRTRPVREVTLTRHWWKLILSGPCLVIVVIVAAQLGSDAWFLGVVTVLTGFVVTAVGVVLGLSHLFNHHTERVPT